MSNQCHVSYETGLVVEEREVRARDGNKLRPSGQYTMISLFDYTNITYFGYCPLSEACLYIYNVSAVRFFIAFKLLICIVLMYLLLFISFILVLMTTVGT
jgi:hypothetical protein